MTHTRTTLHTVIGVIFGAALGLCIALIAAETTSAADGTSTAWATGLLTLYLAGPAGLVIGGVLGGLVGTWAGRRRAEDIVAGALPPDTDGTCRGHYTASWIGGIGVGLLSGFIVLPVGAVMIAILSTFIGFLFPTVYRISGILLTLTVLLSMLSVGRFATRRFDRWVHRARTRAA